MNLRIDPHTAMWLSIRTYVESRMTALRTQLEGDVGFDQTNQIRARLQELKMFLSEAQPDTNLVDVEDYELPG